MSTFAYLLDEHVDPEYGEGIQRQLPEVVIWRIGDLDAPPRGTPDPDILMWCEQKNCVLVTNNRASMPVHLTAHLVLGRHMPGIFILNATMTMGETINELVFVGFTALPDEYYDRIEYLPISY